MDRYAAPTRITFITHAATRQQKLGIFAIDEELDELSIAKLNGLGWIRPATQQIWTSPEMRARQTALALGLNALESADLRECDYGTWSGRSLEDVYAENPAGFASWLTDVGAAPHGGESFRDLMGRVHPWLREIEEKQEGHAIAITHASIVRAAVVYALNAPQEAFRRIDVAPLTITDIRLSGQHWHLRSLGVPLSASAENS